MPAHLTTSHDTSAGVDAADGVPSLAETLGRLARAITTAQVVRVLVEAGVQVANASTGALVLLSDDRRHLRVAGSVGDGDHAVVGKGRLALSVKSPLVDVVQSRRELWLSNRQELAEQYAELVPLENSHAWVALPLLIDGVILGAVGWSFRKESFTKDQRVSLQALARVGGVALYRAGIFDNERLARMRAEVAQYEAARRERLTIRVSSTLDEPSVDSAGEAPLFTAIARLTLPTLGEWCAVHILDQDARLRHLASAHVDPTKDHLLLEVAQRSAAEGRKLPTGLNHGQPIVIEIIRDGAGRAAGLHPDEMRALRRVGLKRMLVMPLRTHDQTLGTLCWASDGTTEFYSDADLVLADRVARRCAAHVEDARLHALVEQATRAREDFVASTSHELRTPLSHIKGFVSTLRTTDTTWDADTRDDFLAEIEHEADRLAGLVEALIDMSRIDSGGLDPRGWALTPPAALVQGGIDRVRATLGERQLDIQLPDDLPRVWVDGPQVERVIANLLDNAAKYSPAFEPIGVGVERDGKSVRFRIEDRGLGIPTADLERVFEPFFREPKGEYPAKPGTGLGLAICRSIIRSQNGQIWAEQRPGGGTVFAFSLPVRAARTARTAR
jgi:nitrogen-specific signal transduction histidine kinase